MTKETITLEKVGYFVTGEVVLNLWGGGQGSIEMKPTLIEELTKENIINSINDNGFGCESYDSAEVYIYTAYGRNGQYIQDFKEYYSFDSKDLINCTRGI